MKNTNVLISDGKKLYQEKEYVEALKVFESLWEESDKKSPTILGYLGLSLRKNEKSEVFVDLCRELRYSKELINKKFVSSTLCWCLYDAHIKTYDVQDLDGFKEFLKRAEYIVESLTQLESEKFCHNPYVLTIIKVVKTYRDKASTNWEDVIFWLSKLNQHELPNDGFEFEDNGKIREMASPKEFYFQYFTKALEKKERFEECILFCQEALKNIEKFHYRNKLWFKARLYYCKCMISVDIQSDIDEYKKIAYRENYWYMYHKLAQICLRNNNIKDSLLYACKAIIAKFEYEKMVNLFFDIAQLWEAYNENDKASLYYAASAFYRERQGWHLPEELRFAVEIYDIDIYIKPNINKMKTIAIQYISELEGDNKISGKVHSILTNGKVGFISPLDSKENVFFRLVDVDDSKGLKRDDKLRFEIVFQEDGRTKAVNIVREK